MELEIVLEQEEDGTYSVHCPALKNIQEAIQLY
jgi:predicted RNase H-like HicB family nuclease